MKPIRIATIAGVILVSFTRFFAKADLLSAYDPRWGADSLTIDTRTGLTWLDLPFTLNLSYLQAEASMRPGGSLEGLRHATAAEVASLYSSAGFEQGIIAESDPRSQKVVSLISMVGTTGASDAVGITGSIDSRGLALMVGMNYARANGAPVYIVTATGPATAYGLSTRAPSVGNWLVLVPEPSSWALLLMGGSLVLVFRGKA